MHSARVLWTGGWDSTFRVLDLVLTRGHPVEPHYVLDPYRLSSMYEIRAMQRIRDRLTASHPEAARRLGALRLTHFDNITLHPDLVATHRALDQRARLGGQYIFLASYAAAVEGLELCVHADDRAALFLTGHVTREEDTTGPFWRLAKEDDASDLALFAPFRFPIFKLTKTQMREAARAQGFLDLMATTWFCYTPRNEAPCGRCNPCRYTIEEGLADRIPRLARLRARLRPTLGALKRFLLAR